MKQALIAISMMATLSACNATVSQEAPQSAAPAPKAKPQPDIKYGNYCNGLYGYCISYPANLYPQPEAQNGDGRIFKDKYNNEVLRVYGRYSEANLVPLNEDFSMSQEEYREDVITYSKLGQTFYVISGYKKDGTVFYKKAVTRKGVLATAVLEYPEEQKEYYDAVSVQIFNSLKVYEPAHP